MRARLCRTRRASCCSGRPPRSSGGTSTTEALPSCGGEAVSSGAGSIHSFIHSKFQAPRNVIFDIKFLVRFLGNIKAAFDKNPSLDNLLLDDFFRDAIHTCQVRSKTNCWLKSVLNMGLFSGRLERGCQSGCEAWSSNTLLLHCPLLL